MGMHEPKKLRKSERTKQAILAVARQLFADQGYERTTVRDIALAAEVDPALVVRYFGGKEALFVQSSHFELGLDGLPALAADELGNTLAAHFLDVWEGAGARGLPVLLRSASSNELAASRIREIFEIQVAPFLAAYLPANERAARATLISSLLLGVALSRYIIRLPHLVALPREELVSMIGQILERLAFEPILPDPRR
jgi:AcrR family transcriptional regulator